MSPARGAADTLVQLDYRIDGDSGCVDEDGLRRMVAAHLGRDPFRSVAAQRVAINLSRSDAGFQGRIVWTEAGGQSVGQRLLSSHGRDCREIAENVAFAVALQLQLIDRGEASPGGQGAAAPPSPATVKAGEEGTEAARTESKDSTESKAPSESKDSTVPTATKGPVDRVGSSPNDPARPERPPALPFEMAVGLGPAIALGLTPEATGAGRLFFDVHHGPLSADVAADVALPVTHRARDGSGTRVNAWGYSASGCAHLSLLGACLLGRMGWLRARGVGVDAPLTSSAHFYQAGLRLSVARQLGRIIVSARADGLVMLARWNVALNDTLFWTVPRVGALFGVDVAYKFF